MARPVFDDPVKELHGKICKHADTIYKQMYGTKFTSKICNPYKGAPSAAQTAAKNKFKTAQAAAVAILEDADQRRAAVVLFKKQSMYKTLRGFVFAQEYNKL